MLNKDIYFEAYPKSETRDARPRVHLMGETRDPQGGKRDLRPGNQLIGGICDLRPETLKMRPETQGPEHLFYMGSKTRDQGH